MVYRSGSPASVLAPTVVAANARLPDDGRTVALASWSLTGAADAVEAAAKRTTARRLRRRERDRAMRVAG
jgi:hypothetical protein